MLLIGCTCASQPVTNVASVAQPPATASFYLTPADCYHGQPSSFWPLLVLQSGQFYSFELPAAPWFASLPQSLRIETPQFDCWAMLSDYGSETWEMQLLQRQESYAATLGSQYRSDWDQTYLTLWPVDRPGACQVWIDYTAPDNYIYATIEPVGCDQIGKGAPFCITFWASNLRTVGDSFVWFGIYAENGGYGGLYATDHPDYQYGLYDVGKRRQGADDYEDFTDDSVYGLMGLDTAQFQGNMRSLLKINIAKLKDGKRMGAGWYDYLRQQQHDSEYPAAIYSSGVATWQEEPVPFAGQSGALFNTVLTISKPGNYVLYFQHVEPEIAQFIRYAHPVPATCGPPVLFQVHETEG